MKEGRPRFVDLFCGAGGMSLGFKNAGCTPALAVDKDRHALEIYRENIHPNVLHKDISDPSATQIISNEIVEKYGSVDEIDILIGGPPCKGFSQANSQTRSNGNPMNQLPFRFIDVVGELHPSAVVMENVPKLLTMKDGEYKHEICDALEKMGYTTDCQILKAEQFGVPQKRRRAFIIAVRDSTPVFPDAHLKSEEQYFSVHQAIGDLPELPEGGGGEDVMDYSPDSEDLGRYSSLVRDDCPPGVVYNHETSINREKTYRRFEHIPPGGNWRDIPEALMDNYSELSKTHDNIYYRLEPDEPAKTVANYRKQMMIHPSQHRLLSVREAARLQSFPDRFRFVGSGLNAKQQMVGNAVPVRMAEAVGRSLVEHDFPNERVVAD